MATQMSLFTVEASADRMPLKTARKRSPRQQASYRRYVMRAARRGKKDDQSRLMVQRAVIASIIAELKRAGKSPQMIYEYVAHEYADRLNAQDLAYYAQSLGVFAA